MGTSLLTFDCCFSGTATRGNDNPQGEGRLPNRGRGWIDAVDGPKPRPRPAGKADDSSGLLDAGEAVARGYVLLTATKSDQVAKEKRDESMSPMGAFSFYLLRALDKANERTTYRDLFERVNAELTGDILNQNPTIEGEDSKLLFSGTASADPYLVVQHFDSDKDVVEPPRWQTPGDDSRLPLCELSARAAT